MPGNRKETMDIREMLRRLQKGQSNRAIAKAMKVNRKTVGRYRTWATEQGLLEGQLPSLSDLQQLLDETMASSPPPQNTSTVEPYRELVVKLRDQKVEIAAIYERMKEREYIGSYSAVYRFVRNLEPKEPEVMVRVETPPGEEGQVDFGFAGMMIDPEREKLRKTWVFVMTLSWSRHQYVEFVFDQKVETWLRLHRNAFAFFGGVPGRIVPDNLKAAIIRACWDEPEAQQAYRECAEHYDFLIAPCRPKTPRHKGKVEQGGIHYVKRNFLGGREPTSITQANEDVLKWVNTTAGLRVHGEEFDPRKPLRSAALCTIDVRRFGADDGVIGPGERCGTEDIGSGAGEDEEGLGHTTEDAFECALRPVSVVVRSISECVAPVGLQYGADDFRVRRRVVVAGEMVSRRL